MQRMNINKVSFFSFFFLPSVVVTPWTQLPSCVGAAKWYVQTGRCKNPLRHIEVGSPERDPASPKYSAQIDTSPHQVCRGTYGGRAESRNTG